LQQNIFKKLATANQS